MFNILRTSFARTSLNLTRKNVSLTHPTLSALSKAYFSNGSSSQASNPAEQKVETQTVDEAVKAEQIKTEAPPKQTFQEYLSNKSPILGKVTSFVVESWEQTFPSDQYKLKAEIARQKAKSKQRLRKIRKYIMKKNLNRYKVRSLNGREHLWSPMMEHLRKKPSH